MSVIRKDMIFVFPSLECVQFEAGAEPTSARYPGGCRHGRCSVQSCRRVRPGKASAILRMMSSRTQDETARGSQTVSACLE